MATALQQSLTAVLFPIVAIVGGGLLATVRPPGPLLRSAVQHFTAGVVFAAIAGELLPDVLHQRAPVPVVLGFAAGVAAMFGVRRLTERLARSGSGAATLPLGLLAAVAVDALLDGLVIGIGFAAGARAGVLIVVALTLEMLFLGLATAASLLADGAGRGRVLAFTAALAPVLAIGAALGTTLLSGLTGGALGGVLAFGCAALLYLVTEELLIEAHEVAETPLVTSLFFVGFLVLLTIEMLL